MYYDVVSVLFILTSQGLTTIFLSTMGHDRLVNKHFSIIKCSYQYVPSVMVHLKIIEFKYSRYRPTERRRVGNRDCRAFPSTYVASFIVNPETCDNFLASRLILYLSHEHILASTHTTLSALCRQRFCKRVKQRYTCYLLSR